MSWGNQKPPLGASIKHGHPLAHGLKSAWLINEGGGGLFLDVGSANHATASGTVPRSAESVDFTATANSLVCASPSPVKTNRITVATWINPATASRGDLVTCWLQGSSQSQFNLLYGLSANSPAFYISDGSSLYNSGDSSRLMTVGKWHFVVGTFDGAEAKVFVDGRIGASTATSPVLNTSSLTAIRFGDNAFGDGNFNGHMRSAMVWDRALSSSEILWLYSDPYAFVAAPTARRRYFVAAGGGSTVVVRAKAYITELLGLVARLNEVALPKAIVTEVALPVARITEEV